jgi:ribosomal protein S18 acetylase RimI-like enzyme
MGVSVRRAGAADAATLHGVAAATFGLACPPGTLPSDIDAFIGEHLSEERFGEYLADEARALLLAEVDGEAVGYSMLVFGEPADAAVASAVSARPTAELSKIYLMEGRHGSGAGQALMTATLDEARQRGVASVWLGVNQQNVRANRFYERTGFARVGVKTFVVGSQTHDDFVRELAF